jgi:hypothetical protein
MNINSYLNQVPDPMSRRAFFQMQAGINALPLTVKQGVEYYVDGNAGGAGRSGLSWDTALDTLTEALALSHANIAAGSRGWASRNTIYCKGDALTEDLTKLADKTDIVGVGSCDGFGPGARLLGNHVISGAYIGCRFINMALKDNDATGTIMTLVTAQGATQFIGCSFLSGTASVVALLATAVTDLRVIGCEFQGSWTSSWSTGALSLGAGSGNRTIIMDNIFGNTHASGVGIVVDISRTGADSWILNNFFKTTAMAIDENSDTFAVVGNRIVTLASSAVGTSVDIPAALSLDNLVKGSEATAIAIPKTNYGAQS